MSIIMRRNVDVEFVGPARVHVEECSYLLTRDLDTVVVACINNRACTLVMYTVSHARCKMQTAATNDAAQIINFN